MKIDYKSAGVNIDAADHLIQNIKNDVKSTFRPEVIGDIGFFGGLFELNISQYKNPVLVSSVDGVGTKLKIAFESKIYHTIGQDLVNHCVNDIAVGGAVPLFFLDYYGTGQLNPEVAQKVIHGLCIACRENGCSLIGGETAEMPGIYAAEEFDLVGTIIGIVDKGEIIDGSKIQPGDALIGIQSNGLHTNGYSLARKILFDVHNLKVSDPFPNTDSTISNILLKNHISYLKAIQLAKNNFTLKGASHITGGGLLDNLPRILPEGLNANINLSSWPTPDYFQSLVELGKLRNSESYRVFNMGIGMVLVVPPNEKENLIKHLSQENFISYDIGEIVPGSKKVELIA